jgi:hypothetical protein
MLTLITTWITARIVTVTTVAVLAVAAVPTTLVLVQHSQVESDARHQQVVLIAAVKRAGDHAIQRLETEEATCTTQINQQVAAAHIAPGKIQSQLAQAKAQLHGSIAPLIAAVQRNEDDVAHLAVVTPEDEQNELSQINLIVLTGLGNGQTTGTVIVTCQTVTVEIHLVIQVTVTQVVNTSEGDDD